MNKYKYILSLSGEDRKAAILSETAKSPPPADLEYLANLLLWDDLAAMAATNPETAPTKTEWAAIYGLPWRYHNGPQLESLEGLREAQASGSHTVEQPLGSLAAPPTSRRHLDPAKLLAAATSNGNGDTARVLLEERAAIYATPNWSHDPDLRARAFQLSRQLYELGEGQLGNYPNADPLTFDTSVVAAAQTPLAIYPIAAHFVIAEDDFILDQFDFSELLAAFADFNLYDWARTSNPKAIATTIHEYWRYQQTISDFDHIIDLTNPATIATLLGNTDIADTELWDILTVLAAVGLSPTQQIVWNSKWNHIPNRQIQQLLTSATGKSRRENYISTIWKQQIPQILAATASQLKDQIETLLEPSAWKRCKRCGRMKPASEVYYVKRKQCADGLAGICKVCEATRRAEKREIETMKKKKTL